jgi:hypothetical protein
MTTNGRLDPREHIQILAAVANESRSTARKGNAVFGVSAGPTLLDESSMDQPRNRHTS